MKTKHRQLSQITSVIAKHQMIDQTTLLKIKGGNDEDHLREGISTLDLVLIS